MNELTNIKVNGAEYTHIEGTGKPLKVVAPVTNDKGITKGKEYYVTGYWGGDWDEKCGWGFHITDDNGNTDRFCIEFNSPHLRGNNWIVTEREQS